MIEEWIANNSWVKWVFSGVGIFAITLFYSFVKKSSSEPKKNGHSISDSTAHGNVQGTVHGNVNVYIDSANSPSTNANLFTKQNSEASFIKNHDDTIGKNDDLNYVQDNVKLLTTVTAISNWLRLNKEKIIHEQLIIILSNSHKYYHKELTSNNALELFKTTISKHIEWMIEGFEYANSEIPLEKYVSTDQTILIKEAYSDFFIGVYNKLENNSELLKEELELLLDCIEYLKELYS